MLVLSRFYKEEIVMRTSDGTIRLIVLDFQKKKGQNIVRLGIDAPRNVIIKRSELEREEKR